MSATQDENGLRNWTCNDCGYSKKYKSHVFIHVERKHVDVQVNCNFCGLTYRSREELKFHVKNKH